MKKKYKEYIAQLQEEIQAALEDSTIGQIKNAHLPGRIKRTVQGLLLRHRIKNAQIKIFDAGNGYTVDVILPPQGPIVGQVHLRFG